MLKKKKLKLQEGMPMAKDERIVERRGGDGADTCLGGTRLFHPSTGKELAK